ncbi:TIGR04211 family SH3 domain-containing protein [Colwellia sp. D2M02]|uniref:TIGR04211 family SH3 domain-containing protein n=1 Tax=Colwellia asteriadis TaxID=517723 RepID=A0ABN1L2C1_9GAMM|nr:TIGR04211 family SH3 domain-containing protein [Colwellia sp. D2M02]MBU2893015.1 TIGR04211 family SH3 domain-containing protein [Colwellia sp. D2M02]
MKYLFSLFISFSLITFTSLAQAEESSAPSTGYISDDLSIFMHAGPGTNYKIYGTITAGAQITITGNSAKDYSEIVDEKNRTAWVESKYITTTPGLRFTVEELNNQVNNATSFTQQLDGEVNQLKSTIADLEQQNTLLTKDAEKLNKALADTSSKLKDQDTNIKKQWFFNGAIVLGFGLVLGLILPKFFTRRREGMGSWK